jgi:hypothetical protein
MNLGCQCVLRDAQLEQVFGGLTGVGLRFIEEAIGWLDHTEESVQIEAWNHPAQVCAAQKVTVSVVW